MDDLFDIKPRLEGYERFGAEPELRELIFQYYKKYFTYDESLELMEKYIGQLIKQYKEI